MKNNIPNRRSPRRALLAMTAVAAALATLPFGAQAQAKWPDKTIRLVVPFPAGGTTDIVGRIAAQELHEGLGVSVIVDNRAGAGGNIGSDIVAKAAPDGYTLLLGTVGTHAINESLYSKLSFSPRKDFAPVTLIATVPNVLVVHPSVKANNVQEFIDLLKANPGKTNYGSAGNGTSIHLSGELFKSMTGTEMTHIPYKGSSPAVADLLGGQVQAMFDNLPSAISHIRSGKLRALAVTSAKRSESLPDVPSIGETVKGFDAGSWFGLLAPAGTPPEIVQRLQTTLVEALKKPEVREKLAQQGAVPVGNTPAEFTTFIESETAKWGKVVKDSGARVD